MRICPSEVSDLAADKSIRVVLLAHAGPGSGNHSSAGADARHPDSTRLVLCISAMPPAETATP